MNRADLEWMAEDLTIRVQNINNWIENNPNTDPNLYEMTDCLMEFGNITSMYTKLIIDEESAKGNRVSNYDIIKLANLMELSMEIRKMMKLRGLIPLDKNEVHEGFPIVESNDYKKIRSDFFDQNKHASHFLDDIYYLAITGAYPGQPLLSEEDFKKKKKVFSKIAAISLYTWQQSRDNVDFVYSNDKEYEETRRGLEEITQIFDEVGIYYYEGGDDIKKMFEEINQYRRKDENEIESSMQL